MVTNEHVLERGKVHYKWDRHQPPAIEVEPGERKEVADEDAPLIRGLFVDGS